MQFHEFFFKFLVDIADSVPEKLKKIDYPFPQVKSFVKLIYCMISRVFCQVFFGPQAVYKNYKKICEIVLGIVILHY